MSEEMKKRNADGDSEFDAGNEIDESIFDEDIGLDTETDGEERKVLTAEDRYTEKQRAKEAKRLEKEEAKKRGGKDKIPVLTKEEEAKRAKEAKKAEIAKRQKAKEKQRKGTFRKKIADVFGELKNVTWPKRKEVVKKLGVVLVVTVLFLAVLMGMDFILQKLYGLLVQGMPS